jgi:peptidoglycan/LPS O-acetylase OafA/YrhL
LPTYLIVALSCAVSLGAAWLFYVVVEKRTLTSRGALKDSTSQVAVAA